LKLIITVILSMSGILVIDITLQSLNIMIIIMREHEIIKSKSDKSKKDEMPPLEGCNDVKYLVDGETLVIKDHLIFRSKRMM